MGLKDLKKKNDQQLDVERKALEFIGGAALISGSEQQKSATRKLVYKRTTFSLTDEINHQIDMLSLTSRTFRVSRSDVVKAGVLALQILPQEQLLLLLAQASSAEVDK
jgi:hypothetical protein